MKAASVIVIFCFTLSTFGLHSSREQESYRQVFVSAGELRIVRDDGRQITIRKKPEQVDFEQVAISPDDHAVGWLDDYSNCCTSYPIPLQLEIYRNGKRRVFRGSEMPIFHWQFQAGGTQVAFEQETVHGALGVHYELHSVVHGRLLAQYTPAHPDTLDDAPQWARTLAAMR